MDPVQIMVDDLAMQVARGAIEAAEWKARALSAEAALAAIETQDEPVEETEETEEESG